VKSADEKERERKAEYRRRQRQALRDAGLAEVLVVVHESRRDDIRAAAQKMRKPK